MQNAIALCALRSNLVRIDAGVHIAYNIDVASFRVYHEATAQPLMEKAFNLMEKTYG